MLKNKKRLLSHEIRQPWHVFDGIKTASKFNCQLDATGFIQVHMRNPEGEFLWGHL